MIRSLILDAAFVLGLCSIGLRYTDPAFWAFVALWWVHFRHHQHQSALDAILLFHQMSPEEKTQIGQQIDQYLQRHPQERE